MCVNSRAWDWNSYDFAGESLPTQPMGYPMKTNCKPDHTEKPFHNSVISFQGYVSRRVGNMRSVILDDQDISLDKIFGVPKAAKDSADKAIGETGLNVRSESDKYL